MGDVLIEDFPGLGGRLAERGGPFARLALDLRQVFQGERVEIESVQKLLANFKPTPKDYAPYAKFDKHRYTRNLIDEGNGKYNLMLLCWGEGHGSAIHDHANAHCFMKILQGRLQETRFEWPDEGQEGPMVKTVVNPLPAGSICYINDSLGLHRVENPSYSEGAVSLHLYCPPFDECSVFNQQTGQKSKSKVTFWSKHGTKHDRIVRASVPPEDN